MWGVVSVTRILAVLGLLLFAWVHPAAAQSPYDPVLSVNGDVITRYEIDQRILFLQLLKRQGDLEAEARDALIEDRLKAAAISAAGITPTDDDIEKEMEAFASRGGVTMDQLRTILGQAGIAFETFEAYNRLNVAWRQLIGSKYGSRVTIGDDEIDRALTLTAGGGLRVLLSEIVLPVNGQTPDETLAFAKDLKQSIVSQADFERAAKRYSASPSREQGGRLDWVDLNRLPQNVQGVILGMSPGDVSPPLQLPQAVVLFQLRSLAEAPTAPAAVAALDYMLVKLPAEGGTARAERMAASSDVCTDLYAKTEDLDEKDVVRETLPPQMIDPRIRAELARLDPGESSTRLRSPDGSQVWLVMLCGRSAAIPEGETREQIALRLRNQRFQALANGYLAELKSAAQVERR